MRDAGACGAPSAVGALVLARCPVSTEIKESGLAAALALMGKYPWCDKGYAIVAERSGKDAGHGLIRVSSNRSNGNPEAAADAESHRSW